MRHAEAITRVPHKPTPDMPEGIYEVIGELGIYWGTYRVSVNWCGERFVQEWYY